jgi:AMP phosphorylase
MQVLSGDGPSDLRHKSTLMAGKLLELCGKVPNGKGYKVAEDLINSGKAMKKFREIIELQGGDKNVKESDLPIGSYSHTITSETNGNIFHIDNKIMSKVARIAGSPKDKGAGVFIHRLRGDRVEKGDKLFTIYAESEAKLDFAIKAMKDLEPIEMRKMILGTVE